MNMGRRLLLPITAGVIAFAGCSVDTSDDAGYDAKRVCQEEFISERLKAPSTADYDLDVTGGPVTYTVSGTVDSENSYGAKLRSDVTCVVELDGDQWKLQSLTGLH